MVKNLKNKKKKKGFTLIELIIVIAIIAILAAIAIPKFGDVRKDAAKKSDIANAKTIANAATALIADGDLADGTYKVDDNTTADNTNLIEGYLQNSPSPKTKGYSEYSVVIASGNVTITMTGTEKDAVNLFPKAD
ncbi:prepilin-type N-terminal cleavage/methylation domain-containing protein [Clostridium sp.]|uniref:prepilin-type N-terminal cleavage/methylation domain-containing protein n=1 Tax=Clostridium sp. TaxID=1506 RepID=UPI00290DBD74|nr:prepilin-type N-terminal cleavage/methylation domain-containing protein [Clostridium sp.]MDU7241560.1 prepilin-type N-terminal cleavage/methylation domain-containing protein [Clostridium sp.]